MLLTGLWGWVVLSVLIWICISLLTTGPVQNRLVALQRTAASVAVAHFPLNILGLYVATFGQFIASRRPGIVLATIVFALWIPRLLVKTVEHSSGVSGIDALKIVAVPYVLWLAWIGRYLYLQLGHLL